MDICKMKINDRVSCPHIDKHESFGKVVGFGHVLINNDYVDVAIVELDNMIPWGNTYIIHVPISIEYLKVEK